MPADWPCPSISPADAPPHTTATASLDSCGHLPTGPPHPHRSPDCPLPCTLEELSAGKTLTSPCAAASGPAGSGRPHRGLGPLPAAIPLSCSQTPATLTSFQFLEHAGLTSASVQHPHCPCCLETSAPLPLVALGKFSGSHAGPWTSSFTWELVSNAVALHSICISHLPFIRFKYTQFYLSVLQ